MSNINTQTPQTPNHFLVLDSFRGLCASLVALSHFNAYSIFHGSPLFDRGAIYVDFFFVLSGFVIFANYSEKLRSGFSLGQYVFLRFARLYPLHLAVLLAFLAVDALQLLIHVEGASLHKPFSAPGETPGAIIANIFMVHSLGMLDTLAFNGPSWSISVEFYAYILFALILVLTGRFYKHAIFATAIISAAIVFLNHEDLFAKLDFGFFRGAYGFACGALLWEFYNKHAEKYRGALTNKNTSNLIEIGLFALTLIYIQFFAFDALTFLAPLIFCAVIFVFAHEDGVVSRILKHKVFLIVGMLSYSIYMTHIFISGKFFALPARLLEGLTDWQLTQHMDGKDLFGHTLLTGTLWEFFYLAIVILCSFISYKIIEEPFRNAAKRFVKKRNAQKKSQAPKHQTNETKA